MHVLAIIGVEGMQMEMLRVTMWEENNEVLLAKPMQGPLPTRAPMVMLYL
jgi:hypothetical protein